MLLLITRPRHDPPTHYLFYWAGLLIDEAKKRGVEVVDLDKEKAKKDKLHSYLSKQPIDIVILNGHGSSEAVAGQGEIILSTESGADLLKDRIMFVRACDSGTILGRKIMEVGAKGFIGYIQPFIFLIDKDYFNKPFEDELARPALDCSNQVGLSLIKGRSAAEAQKDSLNKYAEAIDKYSSSETINPFLLSVLLWNMTNQVCYQR